MSNIATRAFDVWCCQRLDTLEVQLMNQDLNVSRICLNLDKFWSSTCRGTPSEITIQVAYLTHISLSKGLILTLLHSWPTCDPSAARSNLTVHDALF